MTIDKQVARLQYLAKMMDKYAWAYLDGTRNWRGPSERQLRWEKEYEEARQQMTPAWVAYCATTGRHINHDAMDIRA